MPVAASALPHTRKEDLPMSLTKPALLAALGLLIPVLAGAAPEPKGEEEKVPYAIGVSISKSLKDFRLTEAELNHVISGLRDGIAGKTDLDPAAYNDKIRELVMARRAIAAEEEKEASAAWLSEIAQQEGVEALTDGVLVRTLKEGSGDSPTTEDKIRVHYHGTLRDGTVFDSSVEKGEPMEIRLNQLVPCWRVSVSQMMTGGKSEIWCPAATAYGERGYPPKIRPGAAIKFEIELLDILE
jgi:FKBP-type peptidyl-prolyl cis-trans isomerase FkpA